MFKSSHRGVRIKGAKMNASEIKVTVEYIIKAPGDIQVAQVDEFVNDALDEGADSKSIKGRVITDVAFAERPGIIDRMNESLSILNRVEMLTDPDNQDPDAPLKPDDIYPVVSSFLDKVGDGEEDI